MKKFVCTALAIIFLVMTTGVDSYADRGWRGGHGRHGGHVGIGIMLGPWWGLGYPSYPYYPYYAPPPVIIQPQPDVYVQPAPQAEASDYWYYCQNPEGYYPYVKRCPNGWLRVVPSPPADQKE